MKYLLLSLLTALSLVAFTAAPQTAQAEDPPLPACATDGDMDGDGVPDETDSDETDSCLATSTGLEDCFYGTGDGQPDCRVI